MQSRSRSFVLNILFATLTVLGMPAAENSGAERRVRLATVFTFSDAVIDSKKSWTASDFEREIDVAKSLGVQRIYWRIDVGGYYAYPSKVGQVYLSDGKYKGNDDVADSIKAIGDPLRIFTEEANRHGIEVYAYFDIRDRNSTSDSFNPHNPNEAALAAKAGRYPFLSPFLRDNPQYNLERREGSGEKIPVPTISAITLKTSSPEFALTKEDVRIWQSDDNLQYEPVADNWTVSRAEGLANTSIFVIEGLAIKKPWIKIAQRKFGEWTFSGGTLDEWITVTDREKKEWFPYTWMTTNDQNPSFGEARYPYLSAHRARKVRNSIPWDAMTKLSFSSAGASVSLYTPAMPPHRYLLGVPCLAYPEVRAYELAVIDELLGYPIAGIAVSARTHVRANKGEEYGFNAPIAEEYQKRYGTDIRTETYDADKLRKIHGDFFTLLLKEISNRTRAQGRKLIVMYEPEESFGLEFQPGQMAPWWYLGRTDWQWRDWAQADIVDELLIFTAGFNLPWDNRLQDYLRYVRENANGKQISLHYDPDFDPARQNKEAFVNLVTQALASPDLDELCIFEFVEFHDPSQQLNEAMREIANSEANRRTLE